MKIFFEIRYAGQNRESAKLTISFISENNRVFFATFDSFPHIDCLSYFINADYELPVPDSEYDVICENQSLGSISNSLRSWLSNFSEIEFVGDYSKYKWAILKGEFNGILPDAHTDLFDSYPDPLCDRYQFAGFTKFNAGAPLVESRLVKYCYEKLSRN